jgi:hypothetical protein
MDLCRGGGSRYAVLSKLESVEGRLRFTISSVCMSTNSTSSRF